MNSGKYEVYVTFAGTSGYSTAAPFTEYDGNTNLGTVDVNQSILVTQSQGLTQGSYGGVGWLDLGTVSVTSGVFSAVLSNLASGNRVDADGVLLVADSGPAVLVNPPLSSGSAGTNDNLVGLGALDLSTSPPSTTGNSNNSSQVITLNGVSQPAPLSVAYSQGTQPVVNQASPTLVDTVIGLGTSSNANGASSNATITSLAQDIISSKKSS